MAASQFRRSADAWIFRAPTPWVVGPRPHYLLDNSQKAKIELILGASHAVTWLLAD
jgi:hypothetical protein